MVHNVCKHCGNETRAGMVVCHACGEPIDDHRIESVSTAPSGSFDYVSTKIHHWSGVNLLGVVLAGVSIFSMWASIEFVALGANRALGLAVVVLGIASGGILDMIYRLAHGAGGRTQRLFTPLSGGCMLYVPIWIYCIGGPCLLVIIALSNFAAKPN